MQTETGIVVDIDDQYAHIKLLMHSSCNDCGACQTADVKILAYNPLLAKPGATVRFIMHKNSMIKVAFILFFLPLISVFAGIYLGNLISEKINFNPTLMMALGALILLGLSIAFIVRFDRKYKLKTSNLAEIVEIIS